MMYDFKVFQWFDAAKLQSIARTEVSVSDKRIINSDRIHEKVDSVTILYLIVMRMRIIRHRLYKSETGHSAARCQFDLRYSLGVMP